jgi:hypothetical protein
VRKKIAVLIQAGLITNDLQTALATKQRASGSGLSSSLNLAAEQITKALAYQLGFHPGLTEGRPNPEIVSSPKSWSKRVCVAVAGRTC